MILDQGMYEIITATGSIYELCLGEHSTLRRLPGAKPVHPSVDGTSIQSLRRDAEGIRLLSIEQLEVGLAAEFVLDLRGDGVATYRYTSEVTALSFMGRNCRSSKLQRHKRVPGSVWIAALFLFSYRE